MLEARPERVGMTARLQGGLLCLTRLEARGLRVI